MLRSFSRGNLAYSQEQTKEERAATNERNMSLIVKGMDIVAQFASGMSS